MRVLHISPTYFADDSVIGGAERYVLELARTMARREEVVLLSFAEKPLSQRDGSLLIRHLRRAALLRGHPLYGNPFSREFLTWVRWADVVHCHQVRTLTTDVAILAARLLRKKVFITDLGGGHRYAPSHYLPTLRHADGFLLLSTYSKRLWEEAPARTRPRRLHVVSGGIDPQRFHPGDGARSKTALFVGRLLPHKGIDYLIDAIDDGLALRVVGRVYHEPYFQLLKTKSRGRAVTFATDIDDRQLVRAYQESLVTVVPSVETDCYGNRTAAAELLGLVALESMACGTPVILTDVAALPELVEDGVTGFLVPPNDSGALREKLRYLRDHPEVADELGARGKERTLKGFTWDQVVERCVGHYWNSGRDGE